MAAIVFAAEAQTPARRAVVADAESRLPLAGATVFSRQGNVIGISGQKGRMPYVSEADYPLTIRYLGYNELAVDSIGADTVFLAPSASALPEVVVQSPRHKVLHILAYTREYSTLTSYTDTVFLFREKMVDYILTPDRRVKFKGWSCPRLLKGRSYYRFTDAGGLDSVSNASNHHFSWSDWIGIPAPTPLPAALHGLRTAADTIRGRYAATETWSRANDRVRVDIDILADTTSRKWVHNLSGFFRTGLDFERFRVSFDYRNVLSDTLAPPDLAAYAFNIESKGRGHEMFMFNRRDEPFYVSTYGEVYILDKEYVTVKEGREWEKRRIDADKIEIIEAAEAPELRPEISRLVARVDNIDHDRARIDHTPVFRIPPRKVMKNDLGHRALNVLKAITGISFIQSRRNMNRQWREFSRGQIRANQASLSDTLPAASAGDKSVMEEAD